jgi:hypothetical protein
MYTGYTIPTEWPTRADRSTYVEYAKQPSWHAEEAASLAAGFVPRARRDLSYCPLHDEPKEPPPYDGAKTWGALINGGSIGELISQYARHKKVHEWNFSADSLYVTPPEYIDFCAQFDIPIPVDLTEAVRSRSVRKPTKDASPLSNVEQRYRDAILRLANELAPHAKGHWGLLTVDQLQTLVESAFAAESPKIDARTFENYLAKMSKDESACILLAKIRRSAKGKKGDDEKSDLRSWLPPKLAKVLRLN